MIPAILLSLYIACDLWLQRRARTRRHDAIVRRLSEVFVRRVQI